jgi:hypothetical protein
LAAGVVVLCSLGAMTTAEVQGFFERGSFRVLPRQVLPPAELALPRIQAQLRDNQARRQQQLNGRGAAAETRELRNRDLLQRFPNTIRKMQKKRVCLRCKRSYTLCNALGQWQCRYTIALWFFSLKTPRYHPGTVVLPFRRYSCCQEEEFGSASRGCTPIDHSEYQDAHAGILFYQLDPLLGDALEKAPRHGAFHKVATSLPGPYQLTLGPVYRLMSKRDRLPEQQDDQEEPPELDDKRVLDAPRAQPAAKGFCGGKSAINADDSQNAHQELYHPAPRDPLVPLLYIQTAALQPDGARLGCQPAAAL